MNRTVLVVTAVCLLVTAACGGSASTGKATPSPSPSPSPHVVLDVHGSGSRVTGTFTVSAPWELAWSYQCSAGCTFSLDIKTPSGESSPANQGFSHTAVEGQGVLVYHTGGTFFVSIVTGATSSWALKVVG